MHIAYCHYLVNDDTGQNHVRQFVEGIRALGHRIDVYPMNLVPTDLPIENTMTAPYRRLRNSLKKRLSRYLHEPKELLWNPRYILKEVAAIRHSGAEVLLARDDSLNASCVVASKWLGLPLVLEVNAPAEESRMYFDEYFHLPGIAELLQRIKVRKASAVTVVSSSLKEHLVRKYAVPEGKVAVVSNGADLERFSPDTPRDPSVHWESEGGPVIGFVGSFQRWHGPELLGRMIREISLARPGVNFLLVGEGPGIAEIRNQSDDIGSRILFTGKVSHDRIPGLVASFDIGALPDSNFYGSPLKVIEWMAAGKAIVAPRYRPLEDVIDHEVEGLLFSPGDGDGFIRSLLRLVDDVVLRKRLGIAAAERARRSLSWVENARRVVGMCEKALSSHRKSSVN